MAEFCIDCPRRGTCEGEIVSIELRTMTYGSETNDGRSSSIRVEHGVPQGSTDMVARYTDAQGGISEPFRVHGSSFPEAEIKIHNQIEKIGNCTDPIKRARFFGLLAKKACGSIDIWQS